MNRLELAKPHHTEPSHIRKDLNAMHNLSAKQFVAQKTQKQTRDFRFIKDSVLTKDNGTNKHFLDGFP